MPTESRPARPQRSAVPERTATGRGPRPRLAHALPASIKCSSRRNCDGPLSIAQQLHLPLRAGPPATAPRRRHVAGDASAPRHQQPHRCAGAASPGSRSLLRPSAGRCPASPRRWQHAGAPAEVHWESPRPETSRSLDLTTSTTPRTGRASTTRSRAEETSTFPWTTRPSTRSIGTLRRRSPALVTSTRPLLRDTREPAVAAWRIWASGAEATTRRRAFSYRCSEGRHTET